MVFNATFNNISVISWRSALLVEKTGENLPHDTDKLYHIMLYQVHFAWAGLELTTLVVMGTDCIGSCKPNYHTIMTNNGPRQSYKKIRSIHSCLYFFYRGITDIIIIHKEILKLKVEGQMTQAPNRIDSNAQMIEISFQDFRHGSRQFCVKASDR